MEPAGRRIDGDCPSDRRKAAPDAFVRNSVLERECSRLGHATRQVTIIVTLALCTSRHMDREGRMSRPAAMRTGPIAAASVRMRYVPYDPRGRQRARHGRSPLDDVRRRVYLAGILPNTPILWHTGSSLPRH